MKKEGSWRELIDQAYAEMKGSPEAALESAEAALEMVREMHDDPHEDLMRAHLAVADALFELDRLEEAEEHFRRAIQINNDLPESDLTLLAPAVTRCGQIAEVYGRDNEAQGFYQQALPLLIELGEGAQRQTQTLRNNLALLFTRHGKYEEAERLLREALENLPQKRFSANPEAATFQMNLGNCLSAKGDHSTAVECLREAVNTLRSAYGPNHPDVAQAIANLGVARHRQGRTRDAVSELQTAAEIMEKHPQHDVEQRRIILEDYLALLQVTGGKEQENVQKQLAEL